MKAVLAIVLFVAAARAQMAVPRQDLTPGLARQMTAQQTCAVKWGRDARHVSTATKKKVCLAYGISTGCPGKDWELDHLISREIAGADDPKNLWPQPIAEARQKDRLENALHRDVCAGKITLAEAQREISIDWRAAYQKYFPKVQPAKNPLADRLYFEEARR